MIVSLKMPKTPPTTTGPAKAFASSIMSALVMSAPRPTSIQARPEVERNSGRAKKRDQGSCMSNKTSANREHETPPGGGRNGEFGMRVAAVVGLWMRPRVVRYFDSPRPRTRTGGAAAQRKQAEQRRHLVNQVSVRRETAHIRA